MRGGAASALAASFLLSIPAQAETPKLEALFPAGGQVGTSFAVQATGRIDPGVQLWTNAPGAHFVPTGKPREWQVSLSPQAAPGLYLAYAFNSEGASDPRWFSIGRLPETAEAEPNNEVNKPQEIGALPVCINARLDKGGDVDHFSVKLAAGQTLTGWVEAYALGSAVDMVAHVVNPEGVRVHTASDSRNLDPLIVFEAPASGHYTVQLAGFAHPPTADVRFAGGSALVYRLHLTAGAVALQAFPAAVSATHPAPLQLRGPGLTGDAAAKGFQPDAAQIRRQSDGVGLIMPPEALAPLQVLIREMPPRIEMEPNNKPEQAMRIARGDIIAGTIAAPGDADCFEIELKKGEKVRAQVHAQRLGLPLDAWVEVAAPDGRTVATADDVTEQQRDPIAGWTAAADGIHHITVRQRFRHPSTDLAYLLEVADPKPGFEITLMDSKPVVIEAGKTAVVKVQVKWLEKFDGSLIIRGHHFPTGVRAVETAVPDKGGEVEVKLEAAANAPPSGQWVSLAAWTASAPAASQTATASLRGENQRGTTLSDTVDGFWLTVKAAGSAAVKKASTTAKP